MHRINSEAGVDRSKELVQQPCQMADISGWPNSADPNCNDLVINAFKHEIDLPGAEPRVFDLLTEWPHQVGGRERQRLGCQQGFRKYDPALQ